MHPSSPLRAFALCLSLAFTAACGGGGGGSTQAPQAATCSDGARNGAETDVDCGGSACAACAVQKACAADADCRSGLCTAGRCAACAAAAACPGADGACRVRTCTAGTCGFADVAAGTPVAAQIAGDCHLSTCDGAGGTQDAIDDTDVPASGGICQVGACAAGVPQQGPAPAGTTCSTPTGHLCDGAASCVECLAAADCTSGVCAGNTCQAPACTDLVRNGSESDVDCGGGTCPACTAGRACLVHTDCAAGAACSAGVCGAPPAVAISAASRGTSHARIHFGADQFAPGSFAVYRSTAAGSLGTAVGPDLLSSAQEYLDAGLSPATTYHYTVSGAGPQGAVLSTQVSVQTAAEPTFPAAPTGLTARWIPPATIMDLGSVHLEWDPYPGANVYEVYRTPVAELVGNQQFAELLGTPTASTLDDGAVIKGVRYHYFVIAHDTVSVPRRISDPAAVATAAPGATLGCGRPVVDTVSSAPDLLAAQVLFWGGANAKENHVYASLDSVHVTPVDGGFGLPLDTAPYNVPIVQVRPGYYRMDIPWATLRQYFVAGSTVYVAVESWGQTPSFASSSLQQVSFVVPAGESAAIADLAATRLNPRTVRLSWSAPAVVGLDGYDIHRLASPTEALGPANLVAALWADVVYDDTTASPGTSYTYRVVARKLRLGYPSNAVSVRTFSDLAPLVAPPVPVPFSGTAKLGWTSFNDGTTFKVYGGTSLDPLVILSSSLSSTMVPAAPSTHVDFGMTFGGTDVSATQAQLDQSRATLFVTKVWGRWWVSEVYPDGSESAKSASSVTVLF